MRIDFCRFEEMEFPQHGDIVYVFHYVRVDRTDPVPFYVGGSSRHVGRFGDYISANFSAPTDFKVGEAVRYLRDKGLRVIVKFRKSLNGRSDEKKITELLRGTYRLLNDLSGYQLGNAKVNSERQKIRQFVDRILENPYSNERTIPARKRRPRETTPITALSFPKNTPSDAHLTVPERIFLICRQLGASGEIIKRQDILRLARERGINESSVLPADYCDNTRTGKWSRHKFLHSVGPGRYIFSESGGNTAPNHDTDR